MAEETNTDYGRIVYFEPNELFGGDNQPVNQEELTKYVNLSVRIPSRFYNESALRRNYESVLKGTPFVEMDSNNREYTKLYLTDNYVNASYTEFGKNGEISNGELFGIESINISFDVQFQPIVTINFTDVKGFGLMSTMEYNYEDGKINNLTAKSFFTSLFNFPYPIFTLEVKGYYGKSVSFDLALKDFHTAFDSNTGNFKTTVSFIGHLYGVYGDIPMTYLMIAPYIDYTGNFDPNSNQECVGGIWNSLGNTNIKTYLGFLHKYIELLRGEGVNVNNMQQTQSNVSDRDKLEKLNEIKNLYENIILFAKTQLKNIQFSGGCFLTITEGATSLYESTFSSTSGAVKYYNEGDSFVILSEVDSTLNEVCSYNKQLEDGITNGRYDNKYKLTYTEHNVTNDNKCVDRYKLHRFTDIFTKKNNIEEEINTLTTNIENTIGVESQEINRLVSEKIGFIPTIKNVYKMLFKHLDCFSRHFYNVIKNIDPNRVIASNETYYIENINGATPPFPLVYKTTSNGNEIIYPGDIFTKNNMKEIEFVESINNSIEYFSNKFADAIHTISVEQEFNSQDVVVKGYGPLFYDYVNPGKSNYFILQKNDIKPANNEDMAKAIRDMFLARLATYGKIHYLESKRESNEVYFNEKESILLYSSAPTLHKDVIIFLERFYQNEEELYNRYKELSGGTDWGFITFPPGCDLTSGDTHSYKKIHTNNTLETCIIILTSGTQETCEAYMQENFDEYFGFRFHKPINSTKHDEGHKINRYNSKSLCTHIGTDTICRGGKYPSCTTYSTGCDTWTDMHYLEEASAFTCPEYDSYEKHPFFRWFSTKYKWKQEYIKEGVSYGDTYYQYDLGSYEQTYATRDNLNRVVSICLVQLLGIGEVFYNKSNGDYWIPVTFFNEADANWSEGVYLGFRKHFESDELFEKATTGLYKTFFNLSPTPEDRAYYDYFNVPSHINTLEKAYNYWYVIGKNFEYTNEVFYGLNKTKVNTIFKDFVKKLKEKYGLSNTIVEVNNENNEQLKELKANLKLNIYYSLKNLYEKWFSGLPSDFFNINKTDGEFNRVEYLTTTFNDMSESLIVNIESLVEQISSIKDDTDEASKSVISFMASTAQKNLSSFLVLPTKIFNENLKDAFRPFNFFNGGLNHDPYGSTYIVMYNDDVSHQLDIPGSEVENDGFMIADYINGDLAVTDEAKKIMHVTNTHNHTLQAFGVTYGMQNQNFFKNINVNTQTPQITDYAIANMLKLANQGSSMADGRNSFVKQQSIYPVYSNRSYNCEVEMLGCMNITPLMYFQLNNIPMFKGAYIITNVEHTITPHDFITKFTGVRISKYKIPINKESLNLSRIGSIIAAGVQNGTTETENSGGAYENGGGTYNASTLSPVQNMDVSKDIINLDPTGIYFKGYNGTVSGGWCKTGHDCDMSARSTMRNVLANTGHATINSCGNDGGSYDRAIRLVSEKRGDDYIYYYHTDGITMQAKYRQTIQLIKEHLHKGYPVRVSVNHTFNKGINEGTSDHFVAIYAYGIVEENPFDISQNYNDFYSYFNTTNLNNYAEIKSGSVEYFRFYESGSNRQNVGVNARNVFFYVDDPYPLFYCPSDRINRKLDVVNVFPYPDNIINSRTLLSFPLESYKNGVYSDGKNVKVPREKYKTYSF